MSPDPKEKPLHVLIIGGGIAGLSLAAFLQKASFHSRAIRRFTSTVYEAYPPSETAPGPGGFGFAPNGVAAYAPINMIDDIIRLSGISDGMICLTDSGSKLASWKIDKTEYEYPLVFILRDDLLRLLRDRIEPTLSKIEYSKRLVNVEDLGDKVVAHFADGSSAEGDILIGADGSFS